MRIPPPAAGVARVRELLERARREPVHGLFLKSVDPAVAAVVAYSALDFVVVDLEHSSVDLAAAIRLFERLDHLGIPALARVPSVDADLVNHLLEAGAGGIQLSSVRSAASVCDLVAATRYPPAGVRSLSLGQASAGYGRIDRSEYLAAAAAPPIIAQIETASTVDPLSEIFAAGADLVFIGTEDLRLDCETRGLDAEDRIEEIAFAAETSAIPWGLMTSVEDAARRITRGASYLIAGSDLGLLAAAADRHARAVRDAVTDS